MKNFMLLLTLATAGLVCAQPPDGSLPRRGPGDGFGGPNTERRLARNLGLTADQQNVVHTALQEHAVQTKGFGTQMQALHTSLAGAIKSGDTGQIDQISTQMSQLHQQETAAHAKAMAKVYAALTPDQKAKVGSNLEMLLGPGGIRRGGPPQNPNNQ
jgi:Spy/CpxP family protein refolding chaperone